MRILNTARQNPNLLGMGTTLTAAIVDKNELIIAKVGDSRAYLYHNGVLQRLTRDHSLMEELISSGQLTEEEARFHKDRSKITRALGCEANTVPDMYHINVAPGDRLLLCSDGLHGMITDLEIERQLRHLDPQVACKAFVRIALVSGGNDKVTGCVVDINGKMKRKDKNKTKGTSKILAICIAVLLILAIGGATYGLYAWVHNSAYLGEQNGKIA